MGAGVAIRAETHSEKPKLTLPRTWSHLGNTPIKAVFLGRLIV